MTLKLLKSIYKHHKESCKKGAINVPTYSCNECSKVFPFPSKLKEHKKVHGKVKHQCPHCSVKIKREDHYNSHIKSQSCLKINIECKQALEDNVVQGNEENFTDIIDFEVDVGSASMVFKTPEKEPTAKNDVIQLMCENEIVMEDTMPPPRRKQYRISQQKRRMAFSINKLLDSVEQSERKKILERSIAESSLESEERI